MSRYGDDIKGAVEAIRTDGGPATMERVAQADGAEPWNTDGPAVPSTTPVVAVWLAYKQQFIDGARIKTGDQKVLIAAGEPVMTFAPAIGMTLIRQFDGKTERWTVMDLGTLAPNGDNILYTLQVRQ